tara:strand:+ start:545 stop:1027 length:483 start_codon:yes stop_codon:yes gene_type:complete
MAITAMLIKLVDGVPEGYPLIQSNFFQLFPSTSFALPLTPDDVEPFGYGIYEFSDKPEPGMHQNVVEVTPAQDVDSGVWIQQWSFTEQTDEEKAASDAHHARTIRTERTGKLMNCDYTQLLDSPVDSDQWKEYRQALRDLTDQSGFPWDITWPVSPFGES